MDVPLAHDAAPGPLDAARPSTDRLAGGVLAATLVAYAFHAVLAIANQRQLYGDGAWFLVHLVSKGEVFPLVSDLAREFYKSRAVALWLTEAPALLAIRLGVEDLAAISAIFGATLFGWKLASLAVCWRLLPRAEKLFFVFPALGLFAGSINSDIYAISESHVAVAFAWPVLLALRRERPRRWTGDAPLVLAILATSMMYEAFAALAALMLCAFLARAWARGTWSEPRTLWLSAALAVTIGVNALGIAFPRDPTQTGAFVGGLAELAASTFRGVGGLHVGPVVSLAGAAAIAAVILAGGHGIRRWGRGAVAATAVVLAVTPVLHAARFPPRFEDAMRDRGFSAVAMQLALMCAFLAVEALRRDALHRNAAAVAALLGALALGQVAHQVAATRLWRKATASLVRRLDAGSGLLFCPDPRTAPARTAADHVLCRWWVTPLSLVLSRGHEIRAVMLSDDLFPYFDPRDPSSLPSLRFVRRSYGPYLAALDPTALGPREKASFAAGGRGAALLREGFAPPDADGARVAGQRAVLRACGLAVAPDATIRLVFRVRPSATSDGALPEVALSTRGESLATWRFSPGDGAVSREARLAGEAIPPGGCAELELRLGRPGSAAGARDAAGADLPGLRLIDVLRR